MDEDTEASILPVIIIAIFLLLIIGLVVWHILGRGVVGPAPTPIPVAPLTPATNTTNAANPPASVPIVRATSRDCRDGNGDRDCDGSEACTRSGNDDWGEGSSDSGDSSHSSSGRTGSASSNRSSTLAGSCGEILVFDHSFDKEETLALPTTGVIGLTHADGKLYACTDSAIYVYNGNWDLMGSVEDSILGMETDERGAVRVKTRTGDYKLQGSIDSAKMSRCRGKKQMYNGDHIRLSDNGRLLHGSSELARDVDCFCVGVDEKLAYVREDRLHLVDGTGIATKGSRLGVGIDSICMSDEHIYLLVGARDGSHVSGSGSSD